MKAQWQVNYINFLIEAGAMQMLGKNGVLNPFNREYVDRAGRWEGSKVALHPLLAASIN